jgi:DNA mismatch endonuclease (patch repair protein)
VELGREKFARTVERDERNLAALAGLGWRVLVVWECETADAEALRSRLAEFLGEG